MTPTDSKPEITTETHHFAPNHSIPSSLISKQTRLLQSLSRFLRALRTKCLDHYFAEYATSYFPILTCWEDSLIPKQARLKRFCHHL